MNRLQYRIVFNKQRGQLMAVAETANSQSKSSGQSPARRRRRAPRAMAALGTLLLAGGVGLGSPGAVWAQIRPDASAPKNQQPTVLTTANGTPLVNIQTPSAAGVSRNSYSQFDVQDKGVVLNNARRDAATQLGGWVQGNPWLTRGSARVILNEVNSGQPSQLKGFVEIAGQRAELIIANPAGIQVDGSGFINASRATLTTGAVRLGADGGISGFGVQGGLVRIEGKGLDASQTDYTAVLARAVELNAGIWAQDLRITTGTRETSAEGAPVGETLVALGDTPRYALDSSALGGIYAQRITLVGTEAGLGVRQAGQMQGQALTLNAQGWLENSGTLYAQGDGASLQVQGRDGVRNAGWMASQGSITVEGQRVQGEAGSVTVAGLQTDGKLEGTAELRLQASEAQQHGGLLLAPGLVQMQAPSLDLRGAQAQAGELRLSGASLRADRAQLSAQTLLSAELQQDISTQGASLVAGQLRIQAATADNRGGEWLHLGSQAPQIQISGLLNLEGARVAGNGSELPLQAGELRARGARLEQYGSGALRVSGDSLDLRESTLQSLGALALQGGSQLDLRQARAGSSGEALLSAARVDHRGAQLSADAGVQLRVGEQLLNEGGQIQSAAGAVTLRGQAVVSNAGGVIAARETLDLEAASLNQSGAAVLAGRDVRLQLQAGLSQGADSRISADRDLRVQARQLNSEGQLRAGAAMSLDARSSADLGGSSYAGARLDLDSGGDLRLRGLLAAQGDVRAHADGRLQSDAGATLAAGLGADGRVGEGGQLTLGAGRGLALQGQQLAAALSINSAGSLDLSRGQLQVTGQLALQTDGSLNTDGAQLTARSLSLSARDWSHVGGQLRLSGTQAQQLMLQGRLDNQGGLIQSNAEVLTLEAGSLDNRRGEIQHSGQQLKLKAQTLDNGAGRVLAAGDVAVRAGLVDNLDGHLSGRNLDLQVQTLRNSGQGLLAAEGQLQFEGDTLLNAGSVQAKGALVLSSRGVLDNSGRIRALGDARLSAAQLNQQGSSSAAAGLTVQADHLQGSGLFAAGLRADNTLDGASALRLSVGQRLQHAGSLMAGGLLSLDAAELQLQGAQIQAGQFSASARGGALNLDRTTVAVAADLGLHSGAELRTEGAQLSAAQLSVQAVDWLNAGGQIGQLAAGGALEARLTGRLDNRGGQIVANGQRLQLQAAQLDNRQGRIVQTGQGGTLNIQADTLLGERGALLAQGRLDLQMAGVADLSQAQTQAQQLALQAASLNHQGAQTLVLGDARLEIAAGLDNRQGLLQSTAALTLQAGSLRNEDGQLDGRQLSFSGGRLDNLGQGLLQGREGLSLTLDSVHNAGRLQSGGAATLQVGAELRNSGLIYAQGDARIQAGHVQHSGTVAAAGDLRVQADSVASSGSFAAGLRPDNSLAPGGALHLQAQGQLQHSGSSLAAGALSLSAAELALQGSKTQASQIALQARSGELSLEGAQLGSAAALQLQAATALDTRGARLSAAQVDIRAQDWRHAGGQLLQSTASGHLNATLGGHLDNQGGRIEAAGQGLTLEAASLGNVQGRIVQAGAGLLQLQAGSLAGREGQILATGDLQLEIGGAADLSQARTQARQITLQADSLQHQGGQLLAGTQAQLTLRGALDNQAGVLQAQEALQLQSGALLNRDGQLSAKRLDLQLERLDNAGQGLLRAEQDLKLQAQTLSNTGTVQAGGLLDLKLDADLINSGSLYAQGQARLQLGGGLQNSGTVAAQGHLGVNARSISGSGALAAGLRADNILGSEGNLSLQTSQGLQQGGSLLAAGTLDASAAELQLQGSRVQAAAITLSSRQGPLALDRSLLSSPGALTLRSAGVLSSEGASLQGATVDLQASEWRHAGGTLTQRGSGGTLLARMAGQLGNAGGQIQAEGSLLHLEAAHLDNAGGRIAQAGSGELRLQLGSLEGRAGKILASSTLKLNATGAVNLAQGQTQAHDITLQAASLDHQAGKLLSTGAATLTVGGQLDNRGGSLMSRGPMQLHSASLSNGGAGLVQSEAALVLSTDAGLDNQGGQLRSGGEMTLTLGGLDNRAGGQVGSGGALQLKAGADVLNQGGSLVAKQALHLEATSLGNQQGRIASLDAGATLRLSAGLDNLQGQLQAAQQLDLRSGGPLSNRQGEISAGRLLLDSQGQSLDNSGARLLAKELLELRSGTVNNQGGLIRSEGDLNLQLQGAALNNTRDAAISSPTGVHAVGKLDLNAASLLNENGMSSGSTARLSVTQLSNRAEIAAQTLTLAVGDTLDNRGGRLVGSQGLDAQAQQLLNAGGLVYGGNTLTLRVDRGIDNRNTAGQDQGLQGGHLLVSAAQLDNRNGQLRANGDLQLSLSQSVNNAAGQIGAVGELSLSDGGASAQVSALSLDNQGGRIWAGSALKLSVRELVGGVSGEISSRGSLSLLGLNGDWVYGAGSQLQAAGDLSLGLSGRFSNQGVLRSGGSLSIQAVQIDNEAGGELNGRLTLLNAGSGTLSNRGLIDGEGVAITAGQVLNLGSGRLYGGDITLDAASLRNEREGAQAAVIAARRSLDGKFSGEISNRDGALIFADGDLSLSGASLLNENATLEASRWLKLDLTGGLVNRSVHAGAGSGQDSSSSNTPVRLLDSKALIRSGGDMQITSSGTVLNSGATIEAIGDLQLKAGDVRNVNPYLMWRAAGDPLGDRVRFVGYYPVYYECGGDSGFTCTDNVAVDEWVYLNGRTVMRAWGDFVLANPGRAYQIQGAPALVLNDRILKDDLIVFEPYTTSETENGVITGISFEGGDKIRGRHPGQAWEEFVAEKPSYARFMPELVKGGSAEATQSSAARITVGGQLRITGAQITNDMSIVEGRDGVAITGAAVNNLNRTVTVTDPGNGTQRQVALTLPTHAGASLPAASAPGSRAQAGSVGVGPGAGAQAGAGSVAVQASGGAGLGGLTGPSAQSVTAAAQTGPDAGAAAGWRQDAGLTAQAVRAGSAASVDANVQAGSQSARAGVQAALRAALQAQAGGADAQASQLRQAAQAAAVDAVNAGSLGGGRAPGAAAAQTLRGAAASFSGAGLARSVPVGLGLPSNSLFKTRSESSARYLVETDPQFANYREWLSSDYLLQAVAADPATTQKRLGDGFYEQRLVREQLGQLTGASFLPGYSSDEAMYRALLDNGASFAKQHQLRPGVALSAEQMSQLTTDLVWLVEQEVALADGSRQRVLVPQVYLLPREGDLQPSGALITGKRVEMALSGDFTNQGQVRAGELVDVKALNISSSGGGIRGVSVALSGQKVDISNSEVIAGRSLAITASNLGIDRSLLVAGQGTVRLEVQGDVSVKASALRAGGSLLLQSKQGSVDLVDTQLRAAGQTAVIAAQSITTGSTQTQSQKLVDGVTIQSLETLNKTRIEGDKGVTLYGGTQVHLQATDLSAVQGKVSVSSAGTVLLDHNTDTEQRNWTTSSTKRGWGGLKKKTTVTQHEELKATAVRTTLEGQAIEVLGQNVISVGAKFDSTGLLHVEGVDKTLLYSAENTHKTLTDSTSRSSFAGIGYRKVSSQDLSLKTQAVRTELVSDQAVRIGVGERTELIGARIQAPEISFVRRPGEGATGELLIGAAIERDQASSQSRAVTGGVWQKQEGQGHDRSTGQMSELLGTVSVDAGVKLSIELPRVAEPGSGAAVPSLQEQVQKLAGQQPGLAYLEQLRSHPSIKWSEVELAQREWSYKQQGLTGAGAALVALAVAWATGGMGVELLGSTTAGTTTLGGVTLATSAGGLTAAGAALNAGFAGLAASASVSLVNNGGDIGKTLKELGSKDSIKNLLTSMLTAGALNGLSNTLTLNGQTLASITPQNSGFAANLGKAVISNVASAAINSTLTGASLEDSIRTALVGAMASTAGAFGAQAIGSMTVPDAQGKSVLNPAGQLLAHALGGCLAGAAGGGSQGCHSGAIGATVGELAAQWFDPNGTKTEAEVLEFAKLMGATAGALTGDGSAASVNTAANTAANAVQNNYLETRDLKNAIAQLENCKVGCDSLRRLLLGNESAGGQQKPVGRLVDQCKANPQACSTRVQDMAQALQDLQSPEVRAVLGGATADRLIQRQVNDLGQALNALQWGAEHVQSSTAIMRGALMVGATATGAGVLVHVGRALVAACGSGIGTPACASLMTDISIGAIEIAGGVPTTGVTAPVVGSGATAAAAARLTNAVRSADPAAVVQELQLVIAEARTAGGVNSAPKVVELTFDKGTRTWTTPAGVDYGPGSVHGNRVQHVLDHAVPNPNKTTHTVFNVDRKEILGLVDEAWLAKGNPLPNDPGAYVVPMGRVIGTAGETNIKIIVRPGTSKIITAYPVQ
ncbi:MAG: filamentous hemagglutinin N-terminal domain-containing protein [Roseateles asaccharophilus]|uniref:two-partner secretion domain-containing protein n=1 Tax=Roseateles asaccharophilus TaxID=582607 RepID=UPI00391CB760